MGCGQINSRIYFASMSLKTKLTGRGGIQNIHEKKKRNLRKNPTIVSINENPVLFIATSLKTLFF